MEDNHHSTSPLSSSSLSTTAATSNINDQVSLIMEESISTPLTLSALRLLATNDNNNDNNNDDNMMDTNAIEAEVQMIQSQSSYKKLLFRIVENDEKLKTKRKTMTSIATTNTTTIDTTTKSSKSMSLFDMLDNNASLFSTIPSLSSRMNIRDILQFDTNYNSSTATATTATTTTSLLEKCYKANVIDLVLDFNTTEKEVTELGILLYNELLDELLQLYKQSNKDMNQKNQKSFLKLHLKWMKECITELQQHQEEGNSCLSFAFTLVRNVLLSYQQCIYHDPNHHGDNITIIMKSKDMSNYHDTIIIETIIQMMMEYMKIKNDSVIFQQSWLEIVYIMIHTFYIHNNNSNNSNRQLPTILCYYDPKGIFFTQCLSCISSPLIIQRLIRKTSLIQYIMIHLESNNYSDDGSTVVDYLICILKTVIMNISLLQFSSCDVVCHEDERNKRKEILSIDEINKVVQSLCKDGDEENNENNITMIASQNDEKQQKQQQNGILYLLRPFYCLLDIGIEPETYHLLTSTSSSNCSDTVLYLIRNLSLDYTLLVKIMSLLQNLLVKGTKSWLNHLQQHHSNSSHSTYDINTLPLALQTLFHIFKHVFLLLPWNEYCHQEDIFLDNLLTSTCQCLLSLIESKTMIQDTSWDNAATVLLAIIQVIKKTNLWHTHTNHKEIILQIICDYESKVISSSRSIESLLLIHTILFSFKEHCIIEQRGKLLGRKISLYCFHQILVSESNPLSSSLNVSKGSEEDIISMLIVSCNGKDRSSEINITQRVMICRMILQNIDAMLK